MAKQTVNVGNNANDGSGDAARTAFTKINQNMNEVYNVVGDGDNISTKGLAKNIGSIGIGQSWTNLRSNRSYGTNYVNSSGRTIAVFTQVYTVGVTFNALVDGVFVSTIRGSEYYQALYFLVPPGATYSVTPENSSASLTPLTWSELS